MNICAVVRSVVGVSLFPAIRALVCNQGLGLNLVCCHEPVDIGSILLQHFMTMSKRLVLSQIIGSILVQHFVTMSKRLVLSQIIDRRLNDGSAIQKVDF